MHGDRVVVRIERTVTAAAPKAASSGSSSGRSPLVGRYDRDEAGIGFVVPFDRRVLMDIVVPPAEEGGAQPGHMVTVELTRWPTATRGRDRPRDRGARDIDAPGVDTRSSSASTAFPTRTAPRRCRGAPRARAAATAGTTDAAGRTAGRTDFRGARPSRSTASTPATSTMRSPSSGCRTGTSGSACTSPTSRTTSGGQRARPRGVRARHVGVLPRARGPHVPRGTGDRPVQPQPARRPPGAVVPDGGGPPRAASSATSSTTASSTRASG